MQCVEDGEGRRKERTDCLDSDIQAITIGGDWKSPAIEDKVWVKKVTEGGRRFMTAWRKKEVDAARHH